LKTTVAFVILVLWSAASFAADVDYSKLSNEKLVDALVSVDCEAPGLDGSGVYDAFIAEDSRPVFRGGVLGVPPPCIPPQMRELVRHGANALPVLLRHIDDARPTKLIVGGAFGDGIPYMFEEYGDSYDPRLPAEHIPDEPRTDESEKYTFAGKYVVKVGDVCFALIGQIVNRNLIAVRYQPTAGLIVNSPIERPSLAANVRADWSGVDRAGLESSLLLDLQTAKASYKIQPALTRLRFYFPGRL